MSAELAVREVALAGARELARRGQFAEAEELLADAWRDGEPSAACLDLLARIHAQQGRLEAADGYWERAQRLAPGEPAYAAGRARIARLRSGSRRPGRGAAVVVGVVVLVAGGVVLGRVLDRTPDAVRTIAARPGPSAPSSANASAAASTAPSSPAPDVLTALNPRVPGTRIHRAPDELAVTFTRDLFGKDAAFTPSGRAVLTRLGARLRPYRDRLVITVIGYTDDRPMTRGGPYASNLELGEARAGAVREVLRRTSGMPTARITVSSLGGVTAPRARTAVLRISPAQEGGR